MAGLDPQIEEKFKALSASLTKRPPAVRQPDGSQQVVVLQNKDKEQFTESWKEKDRQPGSFIHPFRACIMGRVGSGKTALASQIVCCWAKPAFDRVIVCHPDGTSKDWSHGGVEMVSTPPLVEDFIIPPCSDCGGGDPECEECFGEDPVKPKIALVFDDFALNKLTGEDAINVDRLLGYASSHLGLSIIMSTQRPFNIPVSFRHYCNVHIYYRQPDGRVTNVLEDITALPRGSLQEIFDGFDSNFQYICIDETDGAIWPFRYPTIMEPKPRPHRVRK